MKTQRKVPYLVSKLGSIPKFMWILACIALFFVYAILSDDGIRSGNDEPAARLIGPKAFAHRAVKRAEFREGVRQARAQIVMQDDDLIAYWKKNLAGAACDNVQSKGYSSEQICIEKEAFQQEILKRDICSSGQTAVSCGDEKIGSVY